jgi:hypothetical protein
MANLAISEMQLTPADIHEIDALLAEAKDLAGDVYALERDRNGRHGAIMKYNLNREVA